MEHAPTAQTFCAAPLVLLRVRVRPKADERHEAPILRGVERLMERVCDGNLGSGYRVGLLASKLIQVEILGRAAHV